MGLRVSKPPYMLGEVIQVVNFQTGEESHTSVAIPNDDTIPQNTEGFEVMSLAITPKYSISKLKIDVIVNMSNAAEGQYPAIALFQDDIADALAVCGNRQYNVQGMEVSVLNHFMVAGTTAEITFKVRIGAAASETTFNGWASARKYGGRLASSITITEIKD